MLIPAENDAFLVRCNPLQKAVKVFLWNPAVVVGNNGIAILRNPNLRCILGRRAFANVNMDGLPCFARPEENAIAEKLTPRQQ